MLYWRLSGFYLFFFSSVGLLMPYWSAYLDSLGFSAQEIGILMALAMATKIVSPNIWGWIADKTGRRIRLVRWGSFAAALGFFGVFFDTTYGWLLFVMIVFNFFWNAVLPQFEAITLSHLKDDSHRYSRIRLWGSVGFIVAVTLMGWALDVYGVSLLPAVLMVMLLGIWGVSLFVPECERKVHQEKSEPFFEILFNPAVIALFAGCFLIQSSHGPYYTFFTIYLTDIGYSGQLIGQLWALGVVAEIGIFLVMARIVGYLGLRRLLLLSMVVTAVRWVLIGLYPDHLGTLLFAQILHAASFGMYHSAAIQLIHQYFSGSNQGRGQALYSSLGFGAGSAFGSLYSGYIWTVYGAMYSYFFAAFLACLAFLVAWCFVKELDR
ncbi:MAG TPA: MFS transporter [Gammaproteobacteria bacterium]|nr:MFS transporter [Gammaproteobacteria bacterium]